MAAADVAMTDSDIFGDDAEVAALEREIESKSTEQLESLSRMLDTNIRVMSSEVTRLTHEKKTMDAKIAGDVYSIASATVFPYL